MMSSMSITARFVAVALVIWNSTPGNAADSFELEAVASGLNNPLLVTHAGDGSNRLFILEQAGRILILSDGQLLEQPFLDISSEISSGGERGLLGLAFHPEYDTNGLFFVNYTDRSGDSVISRFSVSGNANRAEQNSETEVLTFRQPFSNHNGGHLAFGPEGYLYIATGDGGSGGDPNNNAQDLGIWSAQPLALQFRSPDRRPVYHRCRPGSAGRNTLSASSQCRRPEDEAGELYVVDRGGVVYWIAGSASLIKGKKIRAQRDALDTDSLAQARNAESVEVSTRQF